MPEERKRRKLKTVGDLRAILSESIERVIDGAMDVHTASAVVKLASQINASLLAEVEVGRVTLANENKLPALGSLAINPGEDTGSAPEPQTIEGKAEAPEPDEPAAPRPSSAAVALASAANSMHAARTSRPSALATRIIDHRSSGVVDMDGMPPPGRSALDQRRAGQA